jgi:pentatricopeptide repeat protein
MMLKAQTRRFRGRMVLKLIFLLICTLFESQSLYLANAFYIKKAIIMTIKPSETVMKSASAQEKLRRLSLLMPSVAPQQKWKARNQQRWKRHRRRQLTIQNNTLQDRRVSIEELEPTVIDISMMQPSWIMKYGRNSSVSSFHMDLQNLANEDASKAHDAVNTMRERYLESLQEGNTGLMTSLIEPDAACYTTVMNGYILEGKLNEAQSILDLMESLTEKDTEQRKRFQQHLVTSILAPTYLTYILMAQAWANAYKDDYLGNSAEKAEAIMRRVMQIANGPKQSHRFRRTNRKATVNNSDRANSNGFVKIWTIVVDGWCKRAGIARQAMIRAEELLLEMEQNPVAIVRPNVLTYTSFICGLSRCKQKDMARRAEEVLERMKRYGVQPDMVAYTAVINCWAKAVSRRERGMAANRAISLLSEMEHLYIYKKVYSAKPSMVTYTTAIAAIGNCLDPVSPFLAEGVIQRMRKFQESGTIANLKPTTAIYNAVIFALGNPPIPKQHRSAERAEMLLNEMMLRAEQGECDVQPDVRTWASVLRAWTRSKLPDAAENAQRLLDRMEHRYQNGLSLIRPNFVCYTTVMGAWGYSKSKNSLDNMEQILKRMEESYEETLGPDVRPNTVSYVTVSHADYQIYSLLRLSLIFFLFSIIEVH